MARTPDAETVTSPDQTLPKRRRKWPWLVLATGLLVWFAPAIAVRTPLRDAVLDYTNPGLAGSIEVGAASAGWMSPIVLRDLAVLDLDGQVVATASEVRSARTLIELATDSIDVGEFYVADVKARLEFRPDGSNLEDLIAPLMEGPSSPDVYRYSLTIENAEALLVNQVSGRTSRMAGIKATVRSTEFGNGYPAVDVELQVAAGSDTSTSAVSDGEAATDADAAGSPQSAGTLSATLDWARPADGRPLLGRARVRGDRLSLRAFEPVIARLTSDVAIDGVARCDLLVEWSDDFSQPLYRFGGGLGVEDVQLVSTVISDRLELRSLQFAGQIEQTPGAVRCRKVRAKTDLADLTADGTVFVADGVPVPDPQAALAVHGTVDVAELANRLPQTLGLRPGMRMTSGVATIDLTGSADADAWWWQVEAKTDRLLGEQDGRQVAWDDPLRLVARLRNQDERYSIDEFRAESEFLNVTGSGSPTAVQLEADCDLSLLKSRLGQFLELSDVRLSGTVRATANVRRDAGNVVSADCRMDASQLAVRMTRDSPDWQERELRVTAAGKGQLVGWSLHTVDELTVSVTSDADTLAARLRNPVAATGGGTDLALPLDVRLEGDIRTWLTRLSPVIGSPVSEAAGQISLTSSLTASGSSVEIEQLDASTTDLRLGLADGVLLSEPSATLQLAGALDLAASSASFETFELRGQAVQAAGRGLELAWAHDLQADATLAVNADLGRVSQWFEALRVDPVRGRLRSNVVVATRGSVIRGQVDATLDNSNLLALLDPAETEVAQSDTTVPIAAGNSSTLICTARYNTETQTLQLETARVDADGLALSASGQIRDVTTRMRTDVSGKLAYDLARLNSLLARFAGPGIQVSGRGNHPFELHGPLLGPTENLEASATLAWESIDAWGLQAGPGVVAATLKRSVLKTEPIEFTLSGGQARLLPRVTLGDRPTLTVLRGTRMQNVALTEQVTAEWLRFVTPLLADSARVRGKFSAAVQSATVPLDDPTTSDVSGVLRIHTATAEPGLMVEQLVGVVDQVRTVLGKNPRGTRGMRVGVPEQEIRFRVLDQRVHHDRFRLEIDGVTLSTSGSVGFDQTLDLVAELTLPDKWLGSSDFTRSLAGQPLRMPIRGTFSQPQIDRSFLRDLTAGAAGRAVNNLLDKQLDRGLNNLLDRIK